MLSTLLGSFTIYADAPKDDAKSQQDVETEEGDANDGAKDGEGKEEAGEVEEEEEPEDVSNSSLAEDRSNHLRCLVHFRPLLLLVGSGDSSLTFWSQIHPALREECSNSAKCIGLKKHFEHCQEKVESGNGFKGEDCVEEM